LKRPWNETSPSSKGLGTDKVIEISGSSELVLNLSTKKIEGDEGDEGFWAVSVDLNSALVLDEGFCLILKNVT